MGIIPLIGNYSFDWEYFLERNLDVLRYRKTECFSYLASLAENKRELTAKRCDKKPGMISHIEVRSRSTPMARVGPKMLDIDVVFR